ncbi:MAG: ankyrin repeat domain-containing protein [Clostridia bacterium]
MKLVREHINEFERGLDPRSAMEIGVKALTKKYLDMLNVPEDEYQIVNGEIKSSSKAFKNVMKNTGIQQLSETKQHSEIIDIIFKALAKYWPSDLQCWQPRILSFFNTPKRKQYILENLKKWFHTNTYKELIKLDVAATNNYIDKLAGNSIFSLGLSIEDESLMLKGLKKGANNLNRSGNKAIQMAGREGYTKLVELLLKDPSVDPSENTKDGIRYDLPDKHYGFRQAASNGHLECVRLFLQHPATEPDYRRNFALKHALRNGHNDVVKLLMSNNKVMAAIPEMEKSSILRLKKQGYIK